MLRRSALVAMFVALLGAVQAFAQASHCRDIGDEPNHQLIYENAAVRIFQMDLAGSKSTEEFCASHGYLRVIATEGKTSDVVTGQVSYQSLWGGGQAVFVYKPQRKAIRNETGAAFREYDIEALQPFDHNPLYDYSCGGDNLACDPEMVSTHVVAASRGPFTVRSVALGTGDQLVIEEASHFVVALSAVELTYGKDKQLRLEPGDARLLPNSEVVLKNAGNRKARFMTVDF